MARNGDLARETSGRLLVLLRRIPAGQGSPWWEAWTLDGATLIVAERAIVAAGRPTDDQLLALIDHLGLDQVRELAFLFPGFTRRVLREHAARQDAARQDAG